MLVATAADRIAALWWLFLAIGAAVFVLVVVLLITPMIRRRLAGPQPPPAEHDDVPPRFASRWIVGFGVVLPGRPARHRPHGERGDDAGPAADR